MKVILHLVYRENQKKDGKEESFIAHLWRQITIPALPQTGTTIQLSFSEAGDEESVPVVGVDHYFDSAKATLVPIIRLERVWNNVGDVETTLDAWRNDRVLLFEEDNEPFMKKVFGFKRGTSWEYQGE